MRTEVIFLRIWQGRAMARLPGHGCMEPFKPRFWIICDERTKRPSCWNLAWSHCKVYRRFFATFLLTWILFSYQCAETLVLVGKASRDGNGGRLHGILPEKGTCKIKMQNDERTLHRHWRDFSFQWGNEIQGNAQGSKSLALIIWIDQSQY